MDIYCCQCKVKVDARLTDGREIYPHRADLGGLPFWKCNDCGNYVGCHHKTDKPTTPLGHIPTPEISKARSHIHALLDPVWKSKPALVSRSRAYKLMSERLGWKYHTAMIESIEEAREVYKAACDVVRSLQSEGA